ncbi:MAG TPA: hypothetical protein P5328_02060 [Candidatus Paceibacterota bacterium]|nr:hypothetical protein [Candidatus Paceibacterota bacterium]HRZ34463.1 hypothetical protein [Candidatus Paceibacterota bacterium]
MIEKMPQENLDEEVRLARLGGSLDKISKSALKIQFAVADAYYGVGDSLQTNPHGSPEQDKRLTQWIGTQNCLARFYRVEVARVIEKILKDEGLTQDDLTSDFIERHRADIVGQTAEALKKLNFE